MNKEVKKLWIDALRSGEYKQGRELLRSANNEFCCLGVLCEIYQQEMVKIGNHSLPLVESDGCYYYGFNKKALPGKVVDWAEIDSCGTYNMHGRPDHYLMLTQDNDNGKSFSEIADIIEKHF